MKKILYLILATFFGAYNSYAEDDKQYPNISGQVLFEAKSDRILSSSKNNIGVNNTYFNLEPDWMLNLNKNWSIKTGWRIWPVAPRNNEYPEKTRVLLSDNRGFNQDQTAFIIEELKIDFENEDMKFFAGKFNPTFGKMYRKSKRIGVFLTDFTEDYELREKIGFGVAALLEDSEIRFNNFFNDVTGLSSSALHNRGRESNRDGLAGNTSTLSSYTLTMEGQNLAGYENLSYNIGYRSLGTQNNNINKRETGHTFNLEYLHKITSQTHLIPVLEYVHINNFTGKAKRDAEYLTTALLIKYSGWIFSTAHISRNIKNNYNNNPTSRDSQLQITAGYRFSNNLAIDVSRSRIRESGYKGNIVGVMFSYLFKF